MIQELFNILVVIAFLLVGYWLTHIEHYLKRGECK